MLFMNLAFITLTVGSVVLLFIRSESIFPWKQQLGSKRITFSTGYCFLTDRFVKVTAGSTCTSTDTADIPRTWITTEQMLFTGEARCSQSYLSSTRTANGAVHFSSHTETAS